MNINNFYLWTALITPLNKKSEIDYKILSKLVFEQSEAGNGLLILGSTAEALNMKISDKKNIIKFVISCKPKSPIMVGVGGHQLEETLEWIKFLNKLKIDALLMVTPIYAKPGAEGQFNWFKKLLSVTNKPVMLYNVPGRTAVALSYEAVKKLSHLKNFWAIKEASGDINKFKKYVEVANGKKIFCGDDAMMFEFAKNGSVGLVSVASNSWPKETNLYVKKCLNQTLNEKKLWQQASDSLFIASNPVPVKRLMYLSKKINSPKLLPPLSEKDLKDFSQIKKFDLEIKKWYLRNSK